MLYVLSPTVWRVEGDHDVVGSSGCCGGGGRRRRSLAAATARGALGNATLVPRATIVKRSAVDECDGKCDAKTTAACNSTRSDDKKCCASCNKEQCERKCEHNCSSNNEKACLKGVSILKVPIFI